MANRPSQAEQVLRSQIERMTREINEAKARIEVLTEQQEMLAKELSRLASERAGRKKGDI